MIFWTIWAHLRGQSCKRIRRFQSKTYWTLDSYKWTVPKPIWFEILSAQFWENVIWKWLKIGDSAKVTRDGNLHARQRHKKNPESFITWIQLDRILNNLNKLKMHRKLARSRRNNLHKLLQIDLVILCKLAKNKGVVKVTWKKANQIRKGKFFNHDRKVNWGRNLKGIGRPPPVAPARFFLTTTLDLLITTIVV